jgi:hypothetical protein
MGRTALNGLDVGNSNIRGELLPAEKPCKTSIDKEAEEGERNTETWQQMDITDCPPIINRTTLSFKPDHLQLLIAPRLGSIFLMEPDNSRTEALKFESF